MAIERREMPCAYLAWSPIAPVLAKLGINTRSLAHPINVNAPFLNQSIRLGLDLRGVMRISKNLEAQVWSVARAKSCTLLHAYTARSEPSEFLPFLQV
jgi:hypothetical protein